MTQDLYNALRLLTPAISVDASPRAAWEQIQPSARPFLRNSFWAVLARKMPFAKLPSRQEEIAAYIWRQYRAAKKAGRVWPPKPIEVKPAVLPQPHTI
jgi:hypothetical protein